MIFPEIRFPGVSTETPKRPIFFGETVIIARTCTALLVAGVAAFIPACSPAGSSNSAPERRQWSVDIQPVASPAGFGSRAPRLTTSDRGVILSWFEPEGNGTALRFAEWIKSGWSATRTAAKGDNWFVSSADLPSVLRMAGGTLVAQWLENTVVEREAYDLWLSYSTDEGRTWAEPFMPHHDGTQSQHGFASLFEVPGQGLGLVWLDGRDNEFDPDDPNRAAMMLRFATYDRDWKQVIDESIDVRVCECCPTSVAVTADGIVAAYRDRSDAEIRDIYISRRENGTWTEGVPVHEDNWEFFACPVNGPSVKARDQQAAVAWFTVEGDQGQAYGAFSSDAGRSWGAPIRLDDAGSLGRVDVELLDDGSAVASWVEFADQRAQFRIRRIEPSGTRSPAVTVTGLPGGRPSGYPRISRHGDELVLAWTESTLPVGEGQPLQRVQTAVSALPRN